MILTNLLLFASINLTSLFSNPPFMIFLQEEKPIIYYKISTATAYWYMRDINAVKNVKNLWERQTNSLWFHEHNIHYIVTNAGSYTVKLHS